VGIADVSLYLAIAALTAAVVVPLLLLPSVRREQQERQRLAARFRPLGDELAALHGSFMALAERIERLEQRIEQQQRRLEQTGRYVDELRLKQEQLDRNTEPLTSGYVQALKLAEKGASADELIELCGLTRGEAELVTMMQRAQRR